MKKSLLAVVTVAVLGLMGIAGAQKFGIYMDYAGYGYRVNNFPIAIGTFGFGGFYGLSDQLRVGGAVEFTYGATGVGVRADYLLGRITLFDEPFSLDLYYGGEAGLTLFFGDEMATQLNVDGLLGFEYVFPKANLGIFSELIVGPSVIFGGGASGFGFGYGGKFGLSFY